MNVSFFVTVHFTGAAAGSALATIAWVHWCWNGVCVLALCLISFAALSHALGRDEHDRCKATEEDIFMEAWQSRSCGLPSCF